MKQTIRSLFLALAFALPFTVEAYSATPLRVWGFGNNFSLDRIFNNLVNLASNWIVWFCATVFLIGAFWKVLFAGNETKAGEGNKIMIGALFGLGVAVLAYAIVRLVIFLVYA